MPRGYVHRDSGDALSLRHHEVDFHLFSYVSGQLLNAFPSDIYSSPRINHLHPIIWYMLLSKAKYKIRSSKTQKIEEKP